MGFLDGLLKTAGNAIVNYASERQEYYDEWYAKYDRCSKEQLKRELDTIKRLSSSSSTAIMMRCKAYKDVCREKGYLR